LAVERIALSTAGVKPKQIRARNLIDIFLNL
jgi:hypothetical protein